MPRHGDGVVLLGFQHATPGRFHHLPQPLAAEFHLGRAFQSGRRSNETRRRQVHATSHLHNAGRDRDAVAIENRIGRRDAAELRAVPPAPHDFDLAVDGENAVRLPAFIRQPLARQSDRAEGGKAASAASTRFCIARSKIRSSHLRGKIANTLLASGDPLAVGGLIDGLHNLLRVLVRARPSSIPQTLRAALVATGSCDAPCLGLRIETHRSKQFT